jgi:hypothetical protein
MKSNLSCSIGLVNDKILTEKRLKRLQANGQPERLADDIQLDVKQVPHRIGSARVRSNPPVWLTRCGSQLPPNV